MRRTLRADPSLIEDSILVKPRRQADYDVLLDALERLVSLCTSQGCEAWILVIPHVGQVDDRYVEYMRELGATFTEPDQIGAADYPFLAGITGRFAATANVHVVDARGALRARARAGPVYFATDEHLTPAGQQAIADLLRERLAGSMGK